MKKQEGTTLVVEEMDWLAAAIGRLGGPTDAGRVLGLSRRAINNWLEHGVANVRCDRILKLSDVSGVPLVHLAKRLGPSQEAQRYFAALDAAKGRDVHIRFTKHGERKLKAELAADPVSW